MSTIEIFDMRNVLLEIKLDDTYMNSSLPAIDLKDIVVSLLQAYPDMDSMDDVLHLYSYIAPPGADADEDYDVLYAMSELLFNDLQNKRSYVTSSSIVGMNWCANDSLLIEFESWS